MSSAYKTTKAELVAIYRLEFYRQKKNWKFSQDVLKGKDSKEKDTKETKPSRKKSSSENEIPAKKLLNETYVVDRPAAPGIDKSFLESESDTNLASEPTTQAKEEPSSKFESKVWTNSSRNVALTSLILNSEAAKEPDLPPIPASQEHDLTDGPSWLEPGDERQKLAEDVTVSRDRQPMKVWSEELEWQESCGNQQVFQPELWSPTREYQLACTRDKVWSREDQIWPQSPESWPEPILWRDNELIWPAASQQQPAKKVDDTDVIWPAAKHQEPAKPVGGSELLWAARQLDQKFGPTKMVCPDESHQQPAKAVNDTHQDPTKTEVLWAKVRQQDQIGPTQLVWPDECQQRSGSAMQRPSGSTVRERWERGWIEAVPQELQPALSPEVLVSTAEEWLHEPLVEQDGWPDNCSHACLSRSMCEFMRGAHCREHSSEIDLSITRELEQPSRQPPAPAPSPAALSQAALSACVKRHAGLLHALLCEARARDQLSAELDEYALHKSNSYEEYPTRDVGLQGPLARPRSRGPKHDNFVSGSFLNDPYFDLESSSNKNVSPSGTNVSVSPRLGSDSHAPSRGRGRLVRDERVIGIRPGGRPYRL